MTAGRRRLRLLYLPLMLVGIIGLAVHLVASGAGHGWLLLLLFAAVALSFSVKLARPFRRGGRRGMAEGFAGLEAELRTARAAEAMGDGGRAWHHLERAHVLSQAYSGPHVRVHWRMLLFALRHAQPREVLGRYRGSFSRLLGSWTGRAPRGNTGGASVGIFMPMPIPEDLAVLLREP